MRMIKGVEDVMSNTEESCMNGCGGQCTCLTVCFHCGICPEFICPLDINICLIQCFCAIAV